MTERERDLILIQAKKFFKENIVAKHLEKTKKLCLDQFNINPFTHKYLSNFALGNDDSVSMAKILIYPRVLGTSISTIFGSQLQSFCNNVLDAYGSTTSGIDIEFIDTEDRRRKYCQLKSGPQTINKDDVKTIKDHFGAIKNLARTNHLDVRTSDCIVGIFYGERKDLSSCYKEIDKEYPVYIGAEFWSHLTGDMSFYEKLIEAFSDVADEVDGSAVLNEIIMNVAREIDDKINE